MLLSMPTALPMELMGPLAGTRAEIENLQKALRNLSQATQRPDIDPGDPSGVVTPQTVTAVIAAQSLVSSDLPSWAFLALQAALAAGSMTSIAAQGVSSMAIPLTVAANTAAVKFKTAPVVAPPGQIVGFFAPGWYKTPLGIALILAVAFVGYKLLVPPTTKAA